MRLHSPLECLSSALNHAAYLALPDLKYEDRDWDAFNAWTPERQHAARTGQEPMPVVQRTRRPRADECEVLAMFAETWGSTALGFGGMGGAAMTPAYTVVVGGPCGESAVYWHGKFAYLVDSREQTDEQRAHWTQDLSRRITVSKAEAGQRYGARMEPFVVL